MKSIRIIFYVIIFCASFFKLSLNSEASMQVCTYTIVHYDTEYCTKYFCAPDVGGGQLPVWWLGQKSWQISPETCEGTITVSQNDYLCGTGCYTTSRR